MSPLSTEEALQQAYAEGLPLQPSESSSTGFKGVSFKSGRRMPYQAQVWRDGKQVALGTFATAEEAALVVARTLEGRAAVAAAAAAPPEPPPMTAEEALRQAEAEELTLLRSESSSTGYTGVSFNSSSKGKPYMARVRRGGTQVHLGYYTTLEEAALSYARTPEARAAAAAPPAPPPMTAEEVLQQQQAEAEGLTLLRSESGSTGYKGVYLDSSKDYTKPYQARVQRGGKKVTIGYFATAEEAALHVARDSEAQAAAQQSPAASHAASSRKRKVRSEEQPPDVPADVVVILEGRFVDGVSPLEHGSAGTILA